MSDRAKLKDLAVNVDAMNNRIKLAEALTSGEHEQVRCQIGRWWDKGSPKCFFGVALYIFDVPRPLHEWDSNCPGSRHSLMIRIKLGLSLDNLSRLILANDSMVAFPILAERLLSMEYTNL